MNGDGYANTGIGLTGTNMFAYCVNNPIMLLDLTGTCAMAWAAGYQGPCPGIGKPGCMDNSVGLSSGTNGNYKAFLDALGMRESSNNYQAVNEFGYLGRYQMGALALEDIGFKNGAGEWTEMAHTHGIYTNSDFLN